MYSPSRNIYIVYQMSKWFLDPRRPVTGGPREEGLMPYVPELRISPLDMISYNHSLPRVSAIYIAPTGLESACIVLVYGLGEQEESHSVSPDKNELNYNLYSEVKLPQ